MKKKIWISLAAGILAGATVLTGIGFALWGSSVSSSGTASASGNWAVSLTGADLQISSIGAQATPFETDPEGGYAFYNPGTPTTDYSLYNLGTVVSPVKSNPDLALGEKTDTLIKDRMNISGTSSVRPWLFAIDTTRYSWDDIKACWNKPDALNAIKYDETSINLDENMYLYNQIGSGRDGYIQIANLFLEDATELVAQMHPDTYQNYMIVKLTDDKHGYSPASCKIAAVMPGKTESLVTYTQDTATFAPVAFSVPDAWAAYTLTVTNNGTVNAYLADTEFTFDAEKNAQQISIETPDLSEEVLAPGESCTLTVVVKAHDDGSQNLDAAGQLTMKLPYEQVTVENAPEAGHAHN